MTQLVCKGRTAFLSYSTNVHPAESLEELSASAINHVAPISRAAFGEGRAAVNLRIGMRQADELLGQPTLPSTSTLSDDILKASPAPACEKFLALLSEQKLDVVSINAFPIRDFHAPRVKEQVYSPPWTDGGRALYSLKIAKVMALFMGNNKNGPASSAISVPSGVFNGLYPDSDEVRSQCAHHLTECARELRRLERLTGKTVVLGLEPEPRTTGEAIKDFISYYEAILSDARQKFPVQLGITRGQAEEIVRKFVTINLDLCHQAVEFEDPVEDLKLLKAAGINLSGLHLSAALQLQEPSKNTDGWAQLKALDEPRYLHQVVARRHNGTLDRYEDLPDLWNPRRLRDRTLADYSELRCHFHVPLFAELGSGGLSTTRESVGPAARYALAEGLTDNFICETYTWNVLAGLADKGNAGARAVVGASGVDVHAGIVKELQWAKNELAKGS